jgi:hypothetical protein
MSKLESSQNNHHSTDRGGGVDPESQISEKSFEEEERVAPNYSIGNNAKSNKRS